MARRLLIRKFSTEGRDPLPFDKIPGPKGIFGIGNIYNYFKFIGNYINLDIYLSENPFSEINFQASIASTSFIVME